MFKNSFIDTNSHYDTHLCLTKKAAVILFSLFLFGCASSMPSTEFANACKDYPNIMTKENYNFSLFGKTLLVKDYDGVGIMNNASVAFQVDKFLVNNYTVKQIFGKNEPVGTYLVRKKYGVCNKDFSDYLLADNKDECLEYSQDVNSQIDFLVFTKKEKMKTSQGGEIRISEDILEGGTYPYVFYRRSRLDTGETRFGSGIAVIEHCE